MNGLPKTTDLTALAGGLLTQLCISEHQIILKVDNEIQISVEGEIDLYLGSQPPISLTDYRFYANVLCEFIGIAICVASVSPDGGLKLKFSEDREIVIRNSSNEYESFQVKIGDLVLVA